MDFKEILESWWQKDAVEPLVCLGIHCGEDRMNEYGTVCQADYKGLGCKAGLVQKIYF